MRLCSRYHIMQIAGVFLWLPTRMHFQLKTRQDGIRLLLYCGYKGLRASDAVVSPVLNSSVGT